jgi:MFS family permease
VHPGSRDLWLLASGQAVSVAGDAAALAALLLRLQPSGSGWVAALLAAELVPWLLLAPLSGRLVDRFETRGVLLVGLAGQAVVAVPLALVPGPAATVAVFFALNAFSTAVRPATAALVPAVVGTGSAERGYARLASGTGFGWVVGPALGGLLTGTLGATAALLVDAGTFAVLALLVAGVRARRHPTRASRPLAGAGDAHERGGFTMLRNSPTLRLAVGISAVAIGCAVVDNVAAPFRYVDELHASDLGYGAYLTVWAIGSLAAVQLVPRLPRRHLVPVIAIGNVLTGLGIAGIGVLPTVPLTYLAAAIGGVGNGLENTTLSALVARHTPAARHGAAFAAVGMTSQAAIGVGTAAAGPLVAVLGAGVAMLAAGLTAGSIAFAGLLRALAARLGEPGQPGEDGEDGEDGDPSGAPA